MPGDRRVRVEIVDIMGGGKCPAGFEVGREWVVADSLCPNGMCASAFHSMLPYLTMLRYGGRFPWREEPMVRVSCPDGDNPVVYKLTAES